MKENFPLCLALTLGYEGGFVDDDKDPGGATNHGVTIGTLKRIGIDVDGDGDSDIADLKNLRQEDLVRVYKPYFWDAVGGDKLPSGLDMCAFDGGVMSGPARGVKWVNEAKGATLRDKVNSACDNRLAFLKVVKHPKTGEPLWPRYGKGWGARVEKVRQQALSMTK